MDDILVVGRTPLTCAIRRSVDPGRHPADKGSDVLVCDRTRPTVPNTFQIVDKVLYQGGKFLSLNAACYSNEHARFRTSTGLMLSDTTRSDRRLPLPLRRRGRQDRLRVHPTLTDPALPQHRWQNDQSDRPFHSTSVPRASVQHLTRTVEDHQSHRSRAAARRLSGLGASR
ncbi:hypothetical protein [Streptomyces vastus]|uniref:hypothetical protein n=1 Tax=Streptomyces vastus TaxID=285451 RepID=UPI0031CE2659